MRSLNKRTMRKQYIHCENTTNRMNTHIERQHSRTQLKTQEMTGHEKALIYSRGKKPSRRALFFAHTAEKITLVERWPRHKKTFC